MHTDIITITSLIKNPEQSNDLIRLVLVGDGFVGKTSMIVR